MTKHLSDIAGETDFWITEAPCHTIHLNAERFLGPYE
jgi:type II restriction enzyme